MLGAGESGKSTVLKQMKLIYATGFSKNEKLEWKPVVFNNIIQSFRLIFEAMQELGIEFENQENEVGCSSPFTRPARFVSRQLPRICTETWPAKLHWEHPTPHPALIFASR